MKVKTNINYRKRFRKRFYFRKRFRNTKEPVIFAEK